MSDSVDARGLSCPQPVILAMEKMKRMGSGEFTIIVDTETSQENVSRAAVSQSWQVAGVDDTGDGYRLTLIKS